MVARVITVAPLGIDGSIVEVECDASKSLPSLQIVGLGNKAIDEARERVRSAISNSLLEFPKKRITINLAPAELPKDGAHYDLPIAIAILCISGQIKQSEISDTVFAGELALNGDLRPIKGAINITEIAKKEGYKKIFLPIANTDQASLIDDMEIFGVRSLKDLFLHIKQELILKPYENTNAKDNKELCLSSITHPLLDDIKGQDQAKRALIIAAAGHHNILISGTPGAGKTMLAKALSNLLPDLSCSEQLEVTKIHSMAGKISDEIVSKRPFRSPHHSSSSISIVGGGNHPKPGEISLAHAGVLFLDELPEYPRTVLESLRQPLEDKKIDIARAKGHVTYPADFMMIATMNPCPCGYFGDNSKECVCTSTQITGYQKKLSGPLMDRIDIIINVSKVPSSKLLDSYSLTNSQHITAYDTIISAKQIQNLRYKGSNKYNSSLNNIEIKKYAHLSKDAKFLLDKAASKLGMSARSYFKTIKVARTIADLEGTINIDSNHISEAIQYRGQSPLC